MVEIKSRPGPPQDAGCQGHDPGPAACGCAWRLAGTQPFGMPRRGVALRSFCCGSSGHNTPRYGWLRPRQTLIALVPESQTPRPVRSACGPQGPCSPGAVGRVLAFATVASPPPPPGPPVHIPPPPGQPLRPLLCTQPSSPRAWCRSAALPPPPAMALGRQAARLEPAHPNPSPCLRSLLQLVISGLCSSHAPHGASPWVLPPHPHAPHWATGPCQPTWLPTPPRPRTPGTPSSQA